MKGIQLTVVLLAGCAAIAVAPGTAAAAKAPSARRPVRIVAPRDHGAVRGGVVTVKVRLGSGVRSFSATVGRRSVARRFASRRGGRLRVARLPVGRGSGLRYGIDTLFVHARGRDGTRGLDIARFAILRRAPGLLAARVPRRTSGAALVRLRLRDPGAKVGARLDGRAVVPPPAGGRRRRLVLAADDGLHYGKNTLRLTAIDRAGGRYDVERRTIRIRRTAPIPGAGRDRRATVRRTMRLDARASRAPSRRSGLRYRWRLVERPRGSRARLRRAGSSRPRLRPDRPGRYRVRLTVAAGRAGRGAATASAADGPAPPADPANTPSTPVEIPSEPPTTPSTPVGPGSPSTPLTTPSTPLEAPASGVGWATDTMTITAAPPTPALGVPIDTLVGTPGNVAVQVGERRFAPPDPSKPLQMVALDRSTLALVANGSYDGDPAGLEKLAAAIGGLSSQDLVILATPQLGAAAPLSEPGAVGLLDTLLLSIGARPVPPQAADPESPLACGELAQGVCSGFSAIGIPGLPLGQGTVNPGLSSAAATGLGNGGAVRGYLQLDDNRNYAFVPGDYVPFDTGAPAPGPRQAAIRVGGTTYTSEPLPAPPRGAPETGGFYVLVLDAGSLRPRAQATFALPGLFGIEREQTSLLEMLQFLAPFTADPSALVFTQSIGEVTRAAVPEAAAIWNAVASEEEKLGGDKLLFNALGPEAAGYTQVGPPGPDASPFTKVAGIAGPARLSGLLARNESGQFYAQTAASASSPLTAELPLVAYRQPTAWPQRETAGQRAAIACITSYLELEAPIQANYENRNDDWGSLEATMNRISYQELPSRPGCEAARFTAADLAAVTAQLDREFSDVATVWKLVENLESPFKQESSETALDVRVIADRIEQSLDVPNAKTSVDGVAILEDSLEMVGELPVVGEWTGAGLASGALRLAGELAKQPSGAGKLDPIPTTADEFGYELQQGYAAALENFQHLGAILVGDWGKLSTVAAKAMSREAWGWYPGDRQAATAVLTAAAERATYASLFPLAYRTLLRVPGDVPFEPAGFGCATPPGTDGEAAGPAWHPFKPGPLHQTVYEAAGTPTVGQEWMFATDTGVDDSLYHQNMLYPAGETTTFGTIPRHYRASFKPRYPSRALYEDMFLDHAAGGALDRPPLNLLTFMVDNYSAFEPLWALKEDVAGIPGACVISKGP